MHSTRQGCAVFLNHLNIWFLYSYLYNCVPGIGMDTIFTLVYDVSIFGLLFFFDALSRGLTIVVSHGLHAPLQQPQSAPPLSSSSIDTLFKVALPYTSSFSIVRCHTILSCSICYFLHLFRALLSGWSMVMMQLHLTRQALM